VQADYVEAAGTRLFVHRWGEGGSADIVYWHGGGGGSEERPQIAPALEEAGYAVYAPDAPGYGDSPPVDPARYRASAVADIAAALIDELGIAPVVWIGYSWGASIGVHTALRAPGRVKALALLDGAYLIPEDEPDYDPSQDLEARTAALREEIEEDDSWDAPVEIMAAAMQGSHTEPALPLLPALERSVFRSSSSSGRSRPSSRPCASERSRASARPYRARKSSPSTPDTASSPKQGKKSGGSCSTGSRGWARRARG
jgi:pimeloyl-ACP methyl ester carboxylesterase